MPSLAEILFKLNGIQYPAVRRAQIEQYFHPETDALPPTDLRPQSMTKFADQRYRSERPYLPATIELPDDIAGRLPYPETFKINSHEVKGHGPNGGLMFGEQTELGRRLGLGASTNSISGGDKPYLSIFDSWDDPSGIKALDEGGTPFNVYDRIQIPLDKNGRYPKFFGSSGRGDIELPKDDLTTALLNRKK